MPLIVEGVKEHKGFMLSQPFEHAGSIMVLTGINGCGKTRLLESIQNGSSVATINEIPLKQSDVVLVEQSKLNPNFGNAYNDAQFQTKITSTLQLFDIVKADFDSPFDLNKASIHRRIQDSLPYESLYYLCSSISKKLKKPASKLSHDEITLYFEDHIPSVLGFQNISSICNQYIKRKNQNKYNRYFAQHEGEALSYLTDEMFSKTFGDRPWEIINQIIEDTFDGKFYFNCPDETSQSYSYNANLIQRDNKLSVNIDALSSGEKTLLWLSLTLFNSQYYDREAIKSAKLLLIDEPDISLHPQMVIKMYTVLDAFTSNFDTTVLITTHSPTTVALASENSTYIVGDNKVTPVDKDSAIAELLDGITQISISPKNRRQVFVESQYDANVYQYIYSKVVNRSKIIDPKISLNFVSSGPKMPEQQLIDKVKQIFKIDDDELINDFVQSVNGIGNCSQVVGQVEALAENGNESIRGIIDRDENNVPSRKVAVLGKDYAYSIENIALDPICVLLLLHMDKPDVFKISDLCGKDVSWSSWLDSPELMQVSVDRFIEIVLGRQNEQNAELSYFSGLTLRTDLEYLNSQGHELEKLLKEKYPQLKSFARSGKDGELKSEVVRKSMITITDGRLIPKAFEEVLSQVQN